MGAAELPRQTLLVYSVGLSSDELKGSQELPSELEILSVDDFSPSHDLPDDVVIDILQTCWTHIAQRHPSFAKLLVRSEKARRVSRNLAQPQYRDVHCLKFLADD